MFVCVCTFMGHTSSVPKLVEPPRRRRVAGSSCPLRQEAAVWGRGIILYHRRTVRRSSAQRHSKRALGWHWQHQRRQRTLVLLYHATCHRNRRKGERGQYLVSIMIQYCQDMYSSSRLEVLEYSRVTFKKARSAYNADVGGAAHGRRATRSPLPRWMRSLHHAACQCSREACSSRQG